MRQLHEIRVPHEPRCSTECLPLLPCARRPPAHLRFSVRAETPARPRSRISPSPSCDHIPSTFAFVPASISITVGHSRLNPSSGHFFVASMPIFDPYVNARLERSSTSTGPIVKRASRSGSMLLSVTHHASRGSRTFTHLSTITRIIASDINPCPHIAFITLYACPGYCLSIETNTRL